MRNIDKSWDGLIFLLTGNSIALSTHPLVKAFFSGQLINAKQDLGYGPAHYLMPVQVKEMSNSLSKFSEAELKRNFIPEKMLQEQVYPLIWDDPEALEDLINHFFNLQNFYAHAADKKEAMITFIV